MITPVVIEPLSLLWCIGIGVSIAISFLILQIGIRIPPDTRRLLMIGMGGVIFYLAKQMLAFKKDNDMYMSLRDNEGGKDNF